MDKRILIVDDDAAIVASLAKLLGETYDVAVASDGLGALKALKAGRFDVVLLDLLMPGLDGVGFVRELQARSDATPILLMSASTQIARHAEGMGVADFLGKPFHIDNLEAKILRILAGNAPGTAVPG